MNVSFLLSLFFLFSLIGCSTTDRKVANVIDPEPKLPSAEALFLKGTVAFKKRKFHPFDENHFGEELDLSQKRPAINLGGTVFAKKFGLPGHSLIGNFFHHGKFWIVRVPDESVSRAFMHIAYFAPKVKNTYLGGHTYLRFELKGDKKIEIVAPMPTEEELSELNTLNGDARIAAIRSDIPYEGESRFIGNVGLTSEAQWTTTDKKKKYDFLRGKNGAFTQITRFISIHTRLGYFLSNGDPLKQVELKMEDPTKVLKAGLMMSERDGLSLRYDTLGQNCTTTAFDVLELGTGVKDRRWNPLRRWVEKRIPTLVIPKTRVWGGGEAISTIDDPTLKKEWIETYQHDFNSSEPVVCPEGIYKSHCQNIKDAIAKIQAMQAE